MFGEKERGSAIVEYTAVAALTALIFLSIIQLALAIHVRNSAIAAASEGARFGALAGNSDADASARTASLAENAPLRVRGAKVSASSSAAGGGGEVVSVRLEAQLPLVGLAGPARSMVVEGHAYRQND